MNDVTDQINQSKHSEDMLKSISFRLLEKQDFHKGFLQVLNQLAPVDDFSEKSFLKNFDEMMKQNKRIYVGEVDGKLVATGTLLLERKFFFKGSYFGHIEDIVVDEKYRGKGYGRQLMIRLVEDAKEYNCARCVLDCIDNKVEFYKKCGFYRRGNQMNYEIHR